MIYRLPYTITSNTPIATQPARCGDKLNVNDGMWHHVAGVYDGWRIALFVDGQLDASCEASGQMQVNDYPVVIGDNAEKRGRQWNGLIDDVRIYSYALSPDEITALHAMTAEASSQ